LIFNRIEIIQIRSDQISYEKDLVIIFPALKEHIAGKKKIEIYR